MIAATDDNTSMTARHFVTRGVASHMQSDVEPIEAASRHTRGRVLRKTVSRGSHAAWKPGTKRADPIALLDEQARFLPPDDVTVRYERMLKSPLDFLQGAAIVMVSDLANTPTTGIRAQLCG